MPGSVIVSGARTPIGKLSGTLASFSASVYLLPTSDDVALLRGLARRALGRSRGTGGTDDEHPPRLCEDL